MYSLILHGRRLVHLQKCRYLINPLQNAYAFSNPFSSASASLKGKTFTVSYLIGSLGLARKLAESISRKVSLEDTCNADSVLSLLRSHGFNDSQISNIISDYPRLLVLDADKSISPKLKFLLSREGVSTSELTEILSKVPKIFGIKKDKATSVYYDFAKEIIEADKSSEFETLRGSSLAQGKAQENKMRNVLVLRELGMPLKLLFPLLVSHHQPVCGKERFEESLKKVVEMGFDPRTTKFVKALEVVYKVSEKGLEERVNVCKKLGFGVGDVWEMFKKWPFFLKVSDKKVTQTFESLKKCGLEEDEVRLVFSKYPQFVSFSENNMLDSTEAILGLGFSRDEFTTMFKRFPRCILLSKEKVTKNTEFIVKNWPRKAVVSMPAVLGLSLEKRIVPRCNVIKVLMSKGLLGSELPPIPSVLAITNEAFLEKYVKNHDDEEFVAELMAIFTRKEEQNLCLK